MRRNDFVKKIAYRMDMTPEKTNQFISTFEDMIMEIIATEDNIRFTFGTIGGRTKKPVRYKHPITGEICYSEEKHGQPYYRASQIAKA